MRKQTSLALALATMMVLGTIGLASPASAQEISVDDVIEDAAELIGGEKVKEHKDEDGKHVYVALGVLGDVVVTCPGVTDVNGDGVLCIGGATADMPEQATSAWDVWITDLVWDRILDENVLMDDVFKVAGFARMDISYNYGALTAARSINNFGFCGQGVINEDGGYLDPWDVMDSDTSMPGALSDRVNKAATKTVFVDSLATFLLDCSNHNEDVYDTYYELILALNMVTCSNGNPLPSVVCITPFPPTSGSQCLEPLPDNIPVPGLIGTIGWRHVDDEDKCHEEAFHQDVNVLED